MLIVCPTPIGNLDDATPRQREALASADVIACEDTRRTGKLLELLGIGRAQGTPKLLSYHEHNEARRAPELVEGLAAGEKVVLVSDAGTPTVADPGYRLVRQAAEAGVDIVALPGPVAAMVALSGSGLPTDRVILEGFLPTKDTARNERLAALKDIRSTAIIYESPYRVVDLLEAIAVVYGKTHPVCVARELTKMHEEYLRGSADQVGQRLADGVIQGEFVVVIAPDKTTEDDDEVQEAIDAKIADLLRRGMRPRGVKEVIAELYEVRRSTLYDRIEQVRNSRTNGG